MGRQRTIQNGVANRLVKALVQERIGFFLQSDQHQVCDERTQLDPSDNLNWYSIIGPNPV